MLQGPGPALVAGPGPCGSGSLTRAVVEPASLPVRVGTRHTNSLHIYNAGFSERPATPRGRVTGMPRAFPKKPYYEICHGEPRRRVRRRGSVGGRKEHCPYFWLARFRDRGHTGGWVGRSVGSALRARSEIGYQRSRSDFRFRIADHGDAANVPLAKMRSRSRGRAVGTEHDGADLAAVPQGGIAAARRGEPGECRRLGRRPRCVEGRAAASVDFTRTEAQGLFAQPPYRTLRSPFALRPSPQERRQASARAGRSGISR